MKTTTVRDLRYDFPRVEAWLRNGDEIELTKHGRPIALISPLPKRNQRKPEKIDFAKQLRKTWGDRVFTAAEVAEMRAAELEGEHG